MFKRFYKLSSVHSHLYRKLSDNAKWKTLKVDRSSLANYETRHATDEFSGSSSVDKEEITELGKVFRSNITLRGPMTLHDYVVQSSNHFIYGYYQNKSNKIGVEGDFVSIAYISK